MPPNLRQMNLPTSKILVIDEDPAVIACIKRIVEPELTVLTASDTDQGFQLLNQQEIGILICNEHLQGESGLQFMARIAEGFSHLQPVLMSDTLSEDLLSFAINEVGVLKYIKKPLKEADVAKAISGAYRHHLTSVETAAISNDYERIQEEIKSMPYIAKRFRTATLSILDNLRIATLAASGTITIVVAIFFLFGVSALLVLYLLKSFLGIDVFAEVHLWELF